MAGCDKASRSGGKCWRHGKVVRCQVTGCSRVPCKISKTGQCTVHLDFPETAASLIVMNKEMEAQQDCSLGSALGKSFLKKYYSTIRITLY